MISDLFEANAKRYKAAARRLAGLRKLTTGHPQAAEVDELINQLRHENRNRPRLQQEFNRVGLP